MELQDRLKQMRWVFLALGSLSLIIFLFLLIDLVSSLLNGQVWILNELWTLVLLVFLLGLGWLLISISINVEDIFKKITKSLVSLSFIFLLVGIFLLAINANSDDLGESIQPSIDHGIAVVFDEQLEEQFQILEGESVSVIYPTEMGEEKTYYAKNLTEQQAENFASVFGYEDDSQEDQIKKSQILITVLYDSLKNEENLLETHISLGEISVLLEEFEEVDEILEQDPALLSNLIPVNENAYLNIREDEDIEHESLQIGNLDTVVIEDLWELLELEEDVSLQTKTIFLDIFLSQVVQLESDLSDSEEVLVDPLPISALIEILPEEIRVMTSYDFFSEEVDVRAGEIQAFRDDCQDDDLSLPDDVCEFIMMTDYNHRVEALSQNETLLEEIEEEEGDEAMVEMTESIIENFGTTEEISENLDGYTSSWLFFILGGIFIMLLSSFVYYLHFRVFDRELVKAHIPYYISKRNAILLISPLILMGIILWLFKSGTIFEITLGAAAIEEVAGIDLVSLVVSLPFVEVFISILEQITIMIGLYFIIAILVYIILRYYLSRSLDQIFKDDESD